MTIDKKMFFLVFSRVLWIMFQSNGSFYSENVQFWFWEDTKGNYMNYSNRTGFTEDIYLPRCSHDPFKHLKNMAVYVLLILTWKSILDETWEIYWRYVKKYKSSHNLDKSTTVKILFTRLQQILDNPNRMKDTNPIWVMDKTFYWGK